MRGCTSHSDDPSKVLTTKLNQQIRPSLAAVAAVVACRTLGGFPAGAALGELAALAALASLLMQVAGLDPNPAAEIRYPLRHDVLDCIVPPRDSGPTRLDTIQSVIRIRSKLPVVLIAFAMKRHIQDRR